jgi:hypothetical protein
MNLAELIASMQAIVIFILMRIIDPPTSDDGQIGVDLISLSYVCMTPLCEGLFLMPRLPAFQDHMQPHQRSLWSAEVRSRDNYDDQA